MTKSAAVSPRSSESRRAKDGDAVDVKLVNTFDSPSDVYGSDPIPQLALDFPTGPTIPFSTSPDLENPSTNWNAGDNGNIGFDNELNFFNVPHFSAGIAPLQTFGNPSIPFDASFVSPTSPFAMNFSPGATSHDASRNPKPSASSSSATSVSAKRQGTATSSSSVSPADATVAAANVTAVGADDDTRMAAEEDKRRRNTAASARFRVKKKQREIETEKKAKEMTEKCGQLEQRVMELERENKWLRELLVEKSGNANPPVNKNHNNTTNISDRDRTITSTSDDNETIAIEKDKSKKNDDSKKRVRAPSSDSEQSEIGVAAFAEKSGIADTKKTKVKTKSEL